VEQAVPIARETRRRPATAAWGWGRQAQRSTPRRVPPAREPESRFSGLCNRLAAARAPRRLPSPPQRTGCHAGGCSAAPRAAFRGHGNRSRVRPAKPGRSTNGLRRFHRACRVR
jgi:hypothetical protein